MLFHVRLTHSPENCWGRDEHEGKAAEFVARMDNAEESHDVSVHSAMVAPIEHTFYLLVESDSYEGLSGLLSGSIGQDHEADVVPVTTFSGAMEALELE
jgi:hypothetical protein